MSALALNDPTKVINIPDEMESIFHVLLWFAIRFLPHNLPKVSVGEFLVDYFDDYTDNKQHFTCGHRKWSSMRHGEIDISNFVMNDSRSTSRSKAKSTTLLKFIVPSDDAPFDKPNFGHPINDVISGFLELLSAYYILRDPNEIPESKDPINKHEREHRAERIGQDRFSRLSAMLLDSDDEEEESDVSPSKKTRSSAEVEKMAKKLESHKEVIKILFRATQRPGGWPEDDKVPDMRPPDGVQRKKRCQPCVATTGKRGHTGDDGEGSHSKRLRSSNA